MINSTPTCPSCASATPLRAACGQPSWPALQEPAPATSLRWTGFLGAALNAAAGGFVVVGAWLAWTGHSLRRAQHLPPVVTPQQIDAARALRNSTGESARAPASTDWWDVLAPELAAELQVLGARVVCVNLVDSSTAPLEILRRAIEGE